VSAPAARYDTIGVGYREHRRPDPRVGAQISAALGDAQTVLNVGAGAGSYEPADRFVVSLDASAVMLAQHPGPRRLMGTAEHLPFADGAFDATLAIFTVHHWSDPARGLAELQRVSRRQVILGFEILPYWLVDEYVPESVTLNVDWPAARIAGALPGSRTEVIPVPHDCTDGFFCAYWRRPEAYLDPGVRGAISGLALLPPSIIDPAMERLADDLRSGAWHARHADLLELDEMDHGYRLVIAGEGT
jgi:SAM-dependent methyltransferase